MPKRKPTPTPTPKLEDSSHGPTVSDEPKPKRTKTSTKTAKKPGRKPGVSQTSRKWTGPELEALFRAGLGGSTSVPAAHFQDAVAGRSVNQCAMAWR